jgi:hypothetical protein
MKCDYCKKNNSLGYCLEHKVCVECSTIHHQTDKFGTYYWKCNSCNAPYCSSCESPTVITKKFDFCSKPDCIKFSSDKFSN